MKISRLLMTVVSFLGIIALGFLGMKMLIATGPKPEKKAPEIQQRTVEVFTAQHQAYQVFLETQGDIVPAKMTRLAAEVAGQIKTVSEKYVVGGIFEEGEVIMELSKDEYLQTIPQIESQLAEAELNLLTEQSRARQARRDWNKLGGDKTADPLLLREPQIASVEARITSLEANLKKARLDLEKTEITAPYACRIVVRSVNLGGYLSPGKELAQIESISELELRCPLSLEEYGYLKSNGSSLENVEVVLSAEIGGQPESWKGRLLRSEGFVEEGTRSIHVVIQLLPYENLLMPPPTGLFVDVSIPGKKINGVVPVPREAFQSQSQLLLLDENDQLQFRDVKILRREDEVALVEAGLNDGDRVILTNIESPIAGMRLSLSQTKKEEK